MQRETVVQPQGKELLHRVAAVGLVMLAFMTGAKLAIMGWPDFPLPYYALTLFTSEFGDLLYTAVFCALGLACLFALRHHNRLRKTAWVVFLAIGIVNILYSAVNVEIVKVLATPLTYSLLQMAGDPRHMRSSIEMCSSPKTVAVLATLPIIFLAAVWGLARWKPLRFTRLSGPLLGLLVVYVAAEPLGRYACIDAAWGSTAQHRALLAINPQWLLMETYVSSATGMSPAGLAAAPVQYFDDFQTGQQQRGASLGPRPARIKNVIVVVLESVGDQFMSLYGSQYPTTPNMQAEAKNSLIFPNFYSHDGSTAQSLIPLVMSIYPGVGWQFYTREAPHMRGETTAEILRRRGYRTAFMTSQDLTYENMDQFLQGRGFESVEDYRDFGSKKLLTSWGGDDPTLFDEMIQWIDGHRQEPFYLCSWTQQTHHPYALTPSQHFVDYLHDDSTRPQINLNAYLNTLRVTDEQLGRLFAYLRKTGLADDTLVVITGDHGEAFARPHVWTSHGTSLYQESINIPLILWNPKLFNPGSENRAVGSHVDLNPTILNILGIPPSPQWQGRSLFDPGRPNRAYTATTAGFVLLGMREDNWKFIYNATVARFELYDLRNDPMELNNLASSQKQRCEALYERVSAWAQFEQKHMDELKKGNALATVSGN